MELGIIIKTAREKKNMSQQDLAQAMGVGISAVSNWENNLRCPRIKEFIKLAQLLEIVPELFPGYSRATTLEDKPILVSTETPTDRFSNLEKEVAALKQTVQEIKGSVKIIQSGNGNHVIGQVSGSKVKAKSGKG